MPPTGERILIIEADPDISDLIGRQSLQPLGYQVTVVSDSGSAIEEALKSPPDLLMLNMNLPGLSGKDLLVAMASRGIKVPMMVIAEKGQEADAIQAFRLGATDVLFWPARDAEVVATVERALSQTHETRKRQKLDAQVKLMNDELQHRVRDLTSLLTIGKVVVSTTDQRLIFDRILEGSMQIAEAETAWLMLKDDKTKAFLLAAHRGLPDAWAKKLGQPVDDGISSLVALSGESLVMNGSPLQKFKISNLGKSAGVIPFKMGGEVIGLLLIVRKADKEIGKPAQILLEAVADYASISLVNARLFKALESNMELARAGEKSRMASLDSVRNAIRQEVQTAMFPINSMLADNTVPETHRQALQTIQAALIRLGQASENTVVPPPNPHSNAR
jgi:DNA-binding response OmpR family regulator